MSKLKTIIKEELVKIVQSSSSIAEILRKIGYVSFTASSYRTLKRRLNKENIDYSHIVLGLNSNKNRIFPKRRLNKEEIIKKWLCFQNEHSPLLSNDHLIKYILRYNLLDHKCYVCFNKGIWENLPLSLQLDHINGKRLDNRIENLRFLCPNCHSQTKTFSGRNKKCRHSPS